MQYRQVFEEIQFIRMNAAQRLAQTGQGLLQWAFVLAAF